MKQHVARPVNPKHTQHTRVRMCARAHTHPSAACMNGCKHANTNERRTIRTTSSPCITHLHGCMQGCVDVQVRWCVCAWVHACARGCVGVGVGGWVRGCVRACLRRTKPNTSRQCDGFDVYRACMRSHMHVRTFVRGMCLCARACMRGFQHSYVCACMRACVRACVRGCMRRACNLDGLYACA